MTAQDKDIQVLEATTVLEGAGVRLKRWFPTGAVDHVDPFLLFDDFRANKPADYIRGFPWHPHRGIETITYVLGGAVEHGDSMGNRGVIRPGDVQWMTAGSGIIHQEMPKGDEAGRMLGFQLWANLPADHKMMDPRYREVEAADIPEVVLDDGATIRVICGTVAHTEGPVRDIVTDPVFLDITIPPRSRHLHPTKPDHTVLAYVIGGQGYFCEGRDPFTYEMQGANYFDMQREPSLGNRMLVLFEKGDQVMVSTEDEPVRFLLLSGRPIGEPVAWYGPIVMNTEEELRVTFEEYRRGTFIKHEKPEAPAPI